MNKNTILVWFRNDLRVSDNEILLQATERGEYILPVYIFDLRHYVTLPSGLSKTGIVRAKFILDSVIDLKKSLKKLGGDLLIKIGRPEEILPDLAAKYPVKEVYHHREVAKEETDVSTLVEESLWKLKLNLKHFIGHTLYHKEDLPFPIKDIPDGFATFRKKVERETIIRASLATPQKLSLPPGVEADYIPTLADLGYKNGDSDYEFHFLGGESAGTKRMNDFLSAPASTLADMTLTNERTTFLSPWIALGCISVHSVYHKIKNGERQGLPKKIVDKLVAGLLWRDYYRFMFKKHGNRFFSPQGFSSEMPVRSVELNEAFYAWSSGCTGFVAVDALMQQLNRTGYIPYKGRVLVGQYLIHRLGVSHLLGAAYFEERSIDFAPASNYGNWAHIAGAGSSGKDNRMHDLDKLATVFTFPNLHTAGSEGC